MKDNTKQILKVTFCTLVALALFVGVILMCIYFAFDNTTKGVADAYTDEEVGVSNLSFIVDEGFYIKNFNESNVEDIERLINYYFYFIPNLMDIDPDTDFYYFYDVGVLGIDYTDFEGNNRQDTVSLFLEISKNSAENNYLHINVLISENYDLYFFELTYDFEGKYLDEFLINDYGSQSTEYPYNYYIDFHTRPIGDTFANQLANEVFGDAGYVDSIDRLTFTFNNYINLGVFFSPNETFANPPVVMPEGVYDYNLQDRYDEGYDDGQEIGYNLGYTAGRQVGYEQGIASQEQIIQDLQNQINQNNALIEQLRDEIRYYESLDLNFSTIDVFNPARMKSSTFVYDGVTYTSNSIVSTDDGWDVYSSTYHNEELPPNYGVGFSLFLPESITNTKFYVYGDITGWYNYTYCSEPDEQGNQQCYQVSDMIATISVGYRNQNGNIVKVGTFTSNLPGTGGVDFFIDTPTNEIVFFVENCNLMEVGRGVQVIYYQYDTQSIYDDGYETGKTQGIKIGREEGYYQGVADANDYSFFSLFTSVFDAPITAIVGKWGDSDGDGVYQREGGMLNFYIPGLDINFAPFLLSLFTIAIIILVIRFVMARKS